MPAYTVQVDQVSLGGRKLGKVRSRVSCLEGLDAEYELEVTRNGETHVVKKRLSDLERLHELLVARFDSTSDVTMPSKNHIIQIKGGALEDRKRRLGTYLDELCSQPELIGLPHIQHFFGFPVDPSLLERDIPGGGRADNIEQSGDSSDTVKPTGHEKADKPGESDNSEKAGRSEKAEEATACENVAVLPASPIESGYAVQCQIQRAVPDTSCDAPFSAKIVSLEIVGERGLNSRLSFVAQSAHVEYSVEVNWGERSHVIKKRFAEFAFLHKMITRRYGQNGKAGTLPRKTNFRHFSQNKLDDRKNALNVYLGELCSRRDLVHWEKVQAFFKLPVGTLLTVAVSGNKGDDVDRVYDFLESQFDGLETGESGQGHGAAPALLPAILNHGDKITFETA